MLELLPPPEQIELTRSETPHIYESGDCWRFRWAGEDHGSFDTEQSAKSVALRFRKQRIMKLVCSSLHLR